MWLQLLYFKFWTQNNFHVLNLWGPNYLQTQILFRPKYLLTKNYCTKRKFQTKIFLTTNLFDKKNLVKKSDQVHFLTIEYFESSKNLRKTWELSVTLFSLTCFLGWYAYLILDIWYSMSDILCLKHIWNSIYITFLMLSTRIWYLLLAKLVLDIMYLISDTYIQYLMHDIGNLILDIWHLISDTY